MRPEERELSHVPRWCIVRTIREQSVAEHAFYVTRYAAEICAVMGVPANTNMLLYCLKHDDEELHSGDIPAPYKKNMAFPVDQTALRYGLTELQKDIVKMADLLEAALFLVDEQLLGNKAVGLVLAELREELEKVAVIYNTDKDGPLGYSMAHWLNLQIDAHQSYRGRIR